MSNLLTLYKQFIITSKAMNTAFDELFPEGHAFTGDMKMSEASPPPPPSSMPPGTLVALQLSIQKWEGIVAGTEVDRGADNCALCAAFTHPYCRGCPVRKAVANWGCEDTPYEEWNRLTRSQGHVRKAETDAQRAAAQAELDFLKSLLPKEQS